MGRKPHINAKTKPGIKNDLLSKKMNPFELHINRTKLNVLGQKNKNDRGMPGVSRARANKVREKTLLDEYKKKHKNNVFKDRRIGEHNPTMDPEKKIALRMAKEMRRQLSKKSLYNLNDDDSNVGLAEETLTFNNDYNFSDEDEDDHEDKQLDYKYVKAQHFGSGGLLTKSAEGGGEANGDAEPKFKSKKERIEEIIAESKMAKATKKKEKEEVQDAVDDLNSQFDDFMKLMKNNKITDDDKEKAKNDNEYKDYDKLTRELTFDRTKKAKATNKLKTPEEIAKEEIERLRALEAARVSRMMGEDVEVTTKTNAWSADDLNDGFVLTEDDRKVISYSEGKLNTGLKIQSSITTEGEDQNNAEDVEEDSAAEGENEDSEDDDDGEEEDDDDEDNYSDILEGSDSEDDDQEDEESTIIDNDNKKEVTTPEDQEKVRTMMEEAKNQIPFTFEVPQQYEGFYALLEGRSPDDMGIILHRMISCNHPSLGNNNTAKCQEIFKYILQTLQMICDTDGQSFEEGVLPLQYIDPLIQPLYTLTQLSSSNAADSLVRVIEEKYSEFTGKRVKKYPHADTFIFLKICGMLFPSSDYQHVVMTPVLCFLTQMLGQCKIATARDFIAAFFTANLLYEYVYTSKRFLPELWNLLQNFVFISIPGQDKTKLPHTGAPFKIVGEQSLLLVLDSPATDKTPSKKFTIQSLNEETELTNNFKTKILNETILLLNKLCKLWIDLPAIQSITSPLCILLDNLPSDNYPEFVKSSIQELQETMSSLPTQIEYLRKKASKPKSLKMLEPSIHKIVDGDKNRHGSKKFQEKQKLTYKYKQERKHAQKALRSDAAFLAKHKHKEIIERDAERKRKVNKLLSELAYQECDFKKIKKKKF